MKKLKSLLKKVIPYPIRIHLMLFLDRLRTVKRRWGYSGGKYYCPVCGNPVREFLSAGSPPRPKARCPICSSLSRHRLDWIYLRDKSDMLDAGPKKFLHVAPEIYFVRKFRSIKNLDYVSADLNSPLAALKMDLTDIPLPSNRFDIIYCSHVLEHIIDDRKALSELFRISKPGGWAVLQVPITSEKTIDGKFPMSSEDRRKAFGQEDHVRACGPDYAGRIRESGFQVEVLRATDVLDINNLHRMGIPEQRIIFLCRKSPEDPAHSFCS